MKREEKRTPTEYIVFNIYDDDHYRNLIGWWNILRRWKHFGFPTLPYLKVNLATKEYVECKNPCPTKESLYNLCNFDWIYETFKDDFTVKIMVARANIQEKTPEKSYDDIQNLALKHGINTRIDSTRKLIATIDKLYSDAALFASMRIIEKVEKFAAVNGKKILYVLSFSPKNIEKRIKEGGRFDLDFVNFLKKKNLPYIDLMEAHVADFALFKTNIEDYLKRYYIGHYNPLGNFFEAFAIKNKLVEMLEPEPMSYVSGYTVSWKSPVS
jgi:hypothetical protein